MKDGNFLIDIMLGLLDLSANKKKLTILLLGFDFEFEPNENFEPGEEGLVDESNDWYGGIPSEDVMDKLNTYYESEDLVNGFRKQSRLLENLNSFSEQELKQLFYEGMGVPEDKTKQEFIELVKEKTEPYFNR